MQVSALPGAGRTPIESLAVTCVSRHSKPSPKERQLSISILRSSKPKNAMKLVFVVNR